MGSVGATARTLARPATHAATIPTGTAPSRPAGITAMSPAAHENNVLRTRALRVLNEIEFNACALSQRPEARALNRRMMNKDVFAPSIRFDKAKPLLIHEPFDSSGFPRH